MRCGFLAAGLLLILLASSASAAQIEVIELRHQLAETLLPTLSAVADEDVVVRAAGARLIVRGSPSAIERMRELVRKLDTPMQSLQISVRRVSVAAAGSEGLGAGREGAEVYRSRSAEDARLVQTVTAMPGRAAFIDTGKIIPTTDRFVALNRRGGAAYTERRRYRHWPEGFYATARLVAGRTVVDISVADSAGAVEGVVPSRRIVSTVSGELGAWLPIGVVQEGAAREGSGIVYSTRSTDSARQRVELRVEVAQ
ncbi:secretin N-terminal domain-containing protein [Nitrococcus mobilis]|uniref:secretin N-terminal domain-containing protein n=1 Tax=Nitrococcus mobilis TaxID=35797 RepID=UPI0002EA6048|nr:secretin N-terminal domain-containing protein [Nitrococcus mobilis]